MITTVGNPLVIMEWNNGMSSIRLKEVDNNIVVLYFVVYCKIEPTNCGVKIISLIM